MTNAREEQQMSNENDEQNRAEETCPRCAGCGQLADSDDREPWSVWMALPVGSALAVTMGLVKPEPCDECGGTGKVAGEHHTGTLDLTGEGNAPGSPISDAVVDAAERTFWGLYGTEESFVVITSSYAMRKTLEAAYPAIRQQVAEEIAGRERVLEILNAHQMHYAYGDDAACLCGWAPTHMRAWHSEHRDHTADMITREIGRLQ